MAFEKKKRHHDGQPIAGFWTRDVDTVLTGVLLRSVANDNGIFWLLRATAPAVVKAKDGRQFLCAVGDIVGLPNSASIDGILDELRNSKGIVRLVSRGKKEGKNGFPFFDLDVEFDEGATFEFPGTQQEMGKGGNIPF